ncbi:MAG: ERF family protein, partial [Methanobrevibacter sp.]|nr:ERF family protein [Methanobrevibacter sp.]
MKLYEKLNEIKYQLSKETIKKSARNQFGSFSYSTLADILPHVVKANHKYKVHMLFDIKEKEGVLKLVNIEDTNEFIINRMRLEDLDKIQF